MKVVSIGGIAADDVDYHMWLEFPFSQPAARLERVGRSGRSPLISQVTREASTLNLGVRIYAADEAESKVLREALLIALDTTTTAVALVVSDDDGGAERYRYVVAQGVDEQREEDGPGEYFVVTLVTHGDTAWRWVTRRQLTWNVTASGQTTVVTNSGSLPARPVYTIKPTGARGQGFAYKVFCPVVWRGGEALRYPTDVVDAGLSTSGLISLGKLYNGGAGYEANLAVMVDGTLRKRWFGDFNFSNTKVWVNLDWFGCIPMYLATGFGSGDTVSEIVVDESYIYTMGQFPYSGILMIDDEIFTYSERDTTTGVFSGVTRAAKGSATQNHAAGAAVNLIQHDIWLFYGGDGQWSNGMDKSGPGNYSGDADAYKPVFLLDGSRNDSWIFEEFGQTGERYQYRAGTWQRGGLTSGTATVGEPWSGIELSNSLAAAGESYWWIQGSLRLAAAALIGRGINYVPSPGNWHVGLYAGGAMYIEVPSLSDGTGELVDFELSHAELREGDTIRFYQNCTGAMTVTAESIVLYWSELDTPVVSQGTETAIYDMALTLENVTTGQRLAVAVGLALNQQLAIDTEQHLVTLLDDGSNQYQGVARNTRRREMLPLPPGNSTLRVTETGLTGVTIYIDFEEQSYS